MLKPEAMDNRDVGLPENAALPNQGLQVGGYNVAGKQFVDPAAAKAEVTAQNTTAAVEKRVLAAQMGIDPSKGIAMKRDMAQGTVADEQAADEGEDRVLRVRHRLGAGAGRAAPHRGTGHPARQPDAEPQVSAGCDAARISEHSPDAHQPGDRA